MNQATPPWNRFRTGTSRLSACEPSTALPEYGERAQREPLIILGAGLAGCWLARLLAERGISVRVIEASESLANGASGNPAGIVKPHVTRTPCPAMSFHVQAHACLMHYLQSLPALSCNVAGEQRLQRCGVLQLVNKTYPTSAYYEPLSAEQSDRVAGLAVSSPALHFPDSGWLNPGELCRSLIDHPGISLNLGAQLTEFTRVGWQPGQPLWQLTLQTGQRLWTTRFVLACGTALNTFEQTQALPIVPARGQMSRFALREGSAIPRCVISGKHYLIPDGDTVVVGATFERGVNHARVSAEDHASNRAALQAMVPDIRVHDQAISGRAGVRATTPDRLPIAGPAPDMTQVSTVFAELRHGRPQEKYLPMPCHEGLYLLGGLGSRGIVTAPLLAQWLANRLMTEDESPESDTDEDWSRLLNPARFRLRDIKRGMADRL